MHTPYRTHTCGQLRPEHIGQRVVLSGWLARSRELGGILFLVLRGDDGIVQLVVDEQGDLRERVSATAQESTVRIQGTVRARPEGMHTPEMPTGQVEVVLEQLEVLGACAQLPFPIEGKVPVNEATRLRHRYLDLRSERMHRNVHMRSQIIGFLRQSMSRRGFTEVHTPILTVSSPEGARDYLVPARLHPGKFYALPQAPQQFKQLLMASGFERYFQIAPCFRDEAGRMDRSPGEFYQLDMEMAFVTQEEIFEVVESLMIETFSHFSAAPLNDPFPRIPWRESMARWGTDKPDMRFGMELQELTGSVSAHGPEFLRARVEQGERVQGLVVPGGAALSRKEFAQLEKHIKGHGESAFAWLAWSGEGEWRGSLAKQLSEPWREQLEALPEAAPGCAVVFISAPALRAQVLTGRLRSLLGKQLGLIKQERFAFCWVVDFPMFELDEETGQLVFSHNPFSMPQGGMESLMEQDPLKILAYQYDLVCNGYELSSGAIRNHRPDIMARAFEMAGYPASALEDKFGALHRAFQYGAPPHGGIAPGIERILMLLLGEENIREVVPFPMNAQAQDVMMGGPGEVSAAQLEELQLALITPASE